MNLTELIKTAERCGESPINAIRDYLESKDSRISYQEAERIVRIHREPKQDTKDDFIEQHSEHDVVRYNSPDGTIIHCLDCNEAFVV